MQHLSIRRGLDGFPPQCLATAQHSRSAAAQAHKQLDDNRALYEGAPEHMREAMLPLLVTSSEIALTVILGDDCYDALVNRLN